MALMWIRLPFTRGQQRRNFVQRDKLFVSDLDHGRIPSWSAATMFRAALTDCQFIKWYLRIQCNNRILLFAKRVCRLDAGRNDVHDFLDGSPSEASSRYTCVPARSSKIICQSRSVSPRSMTSIGLRPPNAGFGASNHDPSDLASNRPRSASVSRSNS